MYSWIAKLDVQVGIYILTLSYRDNMHSSFAIKIAGWNKEVGNHRTKRRKSWDI